MQFLNLFFSRKMLCMMLLGFSSGLPLALVHGSLQAWYTTAGVDIKTIGFLALVGAPYSYKFIWAPVMDRYSWPLLGRRRGWLFCAQLGIVISLIAMARFNPEQTPILLGTLAILLALTAASQDIAVDAYRTEILDAEERGFGSAIFVGGYRIAMIVSGGVAMVLADQVGWQQTYVFMALVMVVSMFVTISAPQVSEAVDPPKNIMNAIMGSFGEFFSRNRSILFLILILTYKMGDAFAHTFSTTFLIKLGFSQTEIGMLIKTLGIAATILGAFIGGIILTRVSLFKALIGFGIFQGLTNLSYSWLAIVGHNIVIGGFAFFVENLFGGMGTSAFFALLMGLCNKQFTATQYALFSSMFAVTRMVVGPVSGYLVEPMGWAWFFVMSCVLAIPGIICLLFLKNQISNIEQYSNQEYQPSGLGAFFAMRHSKEGT